MSKFWNFAVNKATDTQPETVELRIEGDIVDDEWVWLYDWYDVACTSPNTFRNELKEHEGKDVIVWIDSYGGSVFAATGIYNALKEHRGKVVTKVDSKAMSAGSVIFMAGDERYVTPGCIVMTHNPITDASGYASDLRKAADVLDVVKETIINAYMCSGKTREEISQMMEDETYMSANMAVKNGFATGMLYQDEEKKEISNFVFSRLNITNSTNDAIRHLIDMNKNDDLEKEKLLMELDLI